MRAVPSPRGNFMAVPPNGRTAGFAVLLYSKRQSVRLKKLQEGEIVHKIPVDSGGGHAMLIPATFRIKEDISHERTV